MLATRPSRSVTLVHQTHLGLLRTIDAVIGGMLERAIHSIEGLRDHFERVTMLRARRSTDMTDTMPTP